MDQLTALRSLGENTAAPTDHALTFGRAALEQHIANTARQPSQAPTGEEPSTQAESCPHVGRPSGVVSPECAGPTATNGTESWGHSLRWEGSRQPSRSSPSW
jgi:hypothetical protein